MLNDTITGAAPVRQEQPWSTPVQPVRDGQLWCVWEHGGVYEWFAHPEHAAYLLEHGIRIDGQMCPVEWLADWPIGVQLRAVKR